MNYRIITLSIVGALLYALPASAGLLTPGR